MKFKLTNKPKRATLKNWIRKAKLSDKRAFLIEGKRLTMEEALRTAQSEGEK